MSTTAALESTATPPAPAVGRPPPTRVPAALSPGSADGLWVSEETYWKDYYLEADIHYEWNNGRLEEKPVSDYETYLVYAWFVELLRHFLRARPMARMIALGMGFRLPLPDKTVIRKPDLGVVRDDNPQPLRPRAASYRGVFDLCIEALSVKERRGIERDTVTKKAEYAAGGVPEYYILHPAPEHQAFFTRTPAGVYVPLVPEDGVIRSRVLPGLQFRLADLTRQPAPETMRRDPVYADFLLPGWQEAERQVLTEREARRLAENRAEVEAQRALAEARRAEVEAQRALAEARRADAEAQARQEAERALAELRAQLASRRPD